MLARFVKKAILQKGWAGHTISRKETATRLDSLLTQHLTLQAAYRQAASTNNDSALKEGFERVAKRGRLDAGKLAETILSCGGCPARKGDEDFCGTLADVADMEYAFGTAVQDQRREEHHMRTQAVLAWLADNSEDRLEFIRGAVRSRRGKP